MFGSDLPVNAEGQTVEGGHRWYLDGGSIDAWRMDYGFHNGPECKDCHENFCEHCDPHCFKEKCPVSSVSPYLPLEV